MVEVHTEGHLRTADDNIPTILALSLDKAETGTPEFKDDVNSSLANI